MNPGALQSGTPARSPRWWAATAGVVVLLAGTFADARALITVNDPRWRLESSHDGIALFRATVAGNPVIPVKATMTIPGTIEDVSLVLEDIPRRQQWFGNRTESLLLERANDYDQVEYLKVNMPWPVLDRSALIRARITVSGDRRRATITAASIDSHPADTLPRLVRSTVHESSFQMTQAGSGVEVVALVFIDPGGSIPKWIVNYFARRVARSTLAGLRRQVARKLYPASQWNAMHRRIQAYGAPRTGSAAQP